MSEPFSLSHIFLVFAHNLGTFRVSQGFLNKHQIILFYSRIFCVILQQMLGNSLAHDQTYASHISLARVFLDMPKSGCADGFQRWFFKNTMFVFEAICFRNYQKSLPVLPNRLFV
jgi:hypothetical protein